MCTYVERGAGCGEFTSASPIAILGNSTRNWHASFINPGYKWTTTVRRTRVGRLNSLFTHWRRPTMPADHSPGDQLDLLHQQVEKLTQEYAALSAVYVQARRARQFIFLATLLFVLVVCFAFYRRGSQLMGDAYTQELAKIAQARLDKNQNQYMRHV